MVEEKECEMEYLSSTKFIIFYMVTQCLFLCLYHGHLPKEQDKSTATLVVLGGCS